MLLHDDVCLFAHRLHFLHRADLEREEGVRVALVLHLVDLREVPIAQLLHHLEVIPPQQFFVPILDQSGHLSQCQFFLSRGLLLLGLALALAAKITHEVRPFANMTNLLTFT